ncbi:MAG: ABC transporter [Proteobacteria bacterium]|nr:MAG: ABC transporter [Pseudomonadota bacterium]
MSTLKLNETNNSPRTSRDIGQLRFLLPYLKAYKAVVIGALLALIVAASAMLGVGQAIRRIVDMGFSAENAGYIDQYFLALMGVAAALALATFARFYLVSWLGERVIADIRNQVYGHLLSLTPSFFETTKTGEIISRLTGDTTLIQTVVGSSASIALRNLLMLIGGLGLLFVTSATLTAYVLIGVPLVVAPIIFFGRKVRTLSRQSQDRIADVAANAGEKLNAVATIQAFTQEDAERRTFTTVNENAFTTAIRRIRARAWLTAIVILFVFGAVDIVLWRGAKGVVAGSISSGELAAFVFYAIVVAGAVGALSEVWGDLQRAAGACGRIAELLATKPAVATVADPVALPHPGRGEIVFDKVTFHYPSRPDDRALEEFSLHVAPGSTVALVGPSGAGKTTVLQLLMRFYDIQQGEIRLDGVPLHRADPQQLRRRIAIVPQDTVIFAASALDNIRYGRPDASDDEVWAAARAAAAEDFIRALPQGGDTFLGERGARLSGGQRQRIAIARALLKDAPVLLLDEATSALDAESEHVVQAALERLMQGRTTIVIAHRLATVLKADRIVVMDGGRVVAEGTHGELLRQGGLYARLAERQFGNGQSVAAVS